MEQKYRILIVHNRYQIPGGEDTVVQNEMTMLRKHGHDVFLYERNNSELNEFNAIQKLKLPFQTIYSNSVKHDIQTIIKEKQIDIVHVHNTFLLISFSVYDGALELNVPVVQTIHNFRFICPNGLLYRNGQVCEECIEKGINHSLKYGCYRNSKAQNLIVVQALNRMLHSGVLKKLNLICLTSFSKDKLLTDESVRQAKVFIKPNCIPKVQNLLPYSERKNQIVFCGRLDQIKGIQFVLSVWEKLGKDAPKLIVCGDGSLKEECSSFINKYLGKKAKLMGQVDHETVIQYLKESKGMIFASKVYENFPMSIAESLSCGTPVIAPDFGNAGAMIEEDKTGFHYEKESADSCIKAIKSLLSKSDYDIKAMSQMYSEEENYKMLMDIYSAAEEGMK